MSLQIEWQYLQRTVTRVGNIIGPIEDALREAFFPALFGGEEVSSNFREILGRSVKLRGLGIPEPCLSAEHAYNTSKAASDVLVGSLLGGTKLNYVAQKGCVRRESVDGLKHQEFSEMLALTRQKELADRSGLNRLQWEVDNGAWITAISHCLNRTELSI